MTTFSITAITEFVFLETAISKADIILIPGGRPRQLMERAAELYHHGLASLVLPSGGTNSYLPNLTEWEHLRKVGLSLGIPEHAFLKEDKAKNTFENAKFSWKSISEAEIEINAAILVCKAFHARRAHMTYAEIFPRHIQFMVCPIHDERNIRKDNWYTSQEGVSKVMGEIEKIGKYFKPYIDEMEKA